MEDVDGVGLDHDASFSYDGFARLTAASIGTGASAFHFGYAYDALQNMTTRTATGPRGLRALLGAHHYGEAGAGPRQLTSISAPGGGTTHTFEYDAAGRQIRSDDLMMTYDATDRLRRVDGLPGGALLHEYGSDWQRLKTMSPQARVRTSSGMGRRCAGAFGSTM